MNTHKLTIWLLAGLAVLKQLAGPVQAGLPDVAVQRLGLVVE